MKTRSSSLMAGALVLVLALFAAGCSSPTADTEYVQTTVLLTAGSHGFPESGKIIGLSATATYVVRTGNSWYGVTADGTLGTTGTTLADALTDAAVLATADPAGTITGLTNGTRYTTYLVYGTPASNGNTTVNATITGGKNTIYDVSPVQGSYTITVAAGASAFEGGSIVLLTDTDGLLANAGGPVTQYTRIKGTVTSGLTYQAGATVAGSATLEPVADGDNYIVLNNISSNFNAVFSYSAGVATTVLAAKSQLATVADGGFSAITVAGTYVVKHLGNWYAVTGEATPYTLTPQANVKAAVDATSVALLTSDGITGLINDEVYDLYKVGVLAASDGIDNDAVALDTDALNCIADIRALASGEQVAVLAAAFPASGMYLIFLTADDAPLAAGDSVTIGANSTTYTVGTSTTDRAIRMPVMAAPGPPPAASSR